MKSVRVSLKDRSYSILIGRGLLSDAGRLIRKSGIDAGRAIVVSQKEIAALHESTLTQSLKAAGIEAFTYLTPPSKSSEASKTQTVFLDLLSFIASKDGKNRSLFLIALGGGVIGDLTGFAASVYRRGIPLVQIPTTLTAQVDSAIGGKNGIDLPEGKNLLGTIYQPTLVLSDPAVCQTLSQRHLSDGFAEVIKYGIIRDAHLFSLLEKEGKEGILEKPALLEKVIHRSSQIKADVVASDEEDKKDIRIILNFGHTAGHAIEKVSGFSSSYTHGESVGIGMLVACDIAAKQGLLKDKDLPVRLEKVLLKFGLPVFYRALPTPQLLEAIGYDKKSSKGKNRFVLPISLERTTIVRDVPKETISWALERRKR